MQYMIEPIGSQFNNKQTAELAARFTARAREGYALHSVFEVTDPGCMGFGASRTYLAVYVKHS
jgi:hypothetical protein